MHCRAIHLGMSELPGELPFQFGVRRMFLIMSLLAVLCASTAAIRSASPIWLFVPFILAQAIQIGLLMTLPCRMAFRGCVRGLIIGAAVSVFLLLIGGVPALSGLLPFLTIGNTLEPFVATPIGLVLTGAGFSLMCGILSGSITLVIAGNRATGALSLVLLVVWLFLVSLAVLTRGPTFEGSRLAGCGNPQAAREQVGAARAVASLKI